MKLHNKSFFAFFAVSAVFLLTITSCKKSNSSSGSNQVTATIGGTAWASNVSVPGLYVTASGAFELGAGYYKSGDTSVVVIAFTTPFTLHAAISSDTSSLEIGYATNVAQYDGSALSGHSLLTVSSWDSVNHKISGTFSGVLYNVLNGADSLIVTNGSFSSSYTVQ